MKIALIQDWLTGMRGGEKVLEVLCDLFPSADLFTLIHAPGRLSPTIERHRIITSPLQKLPNVTQYYRQLLPLMPWAIESFDFTGYDLLVSTSHCVAKAARPIGNAKHFSYSHTPMRYIWDQYDQYFGPGRASLPTRIAMRSIRPWLQSWDVATADRVDHFLANSKNIQERISRIYHRDADVIYPPVDVDFYATAVERLPAMPKEPFYLIVSAFAPYKRLDIALRAFNQLQKPIVIIGEGQEEETLRSIAGPQATFLGWRSAEELRAYYQHAEALIFPGEEDFGIVPVEAMAGGCPIIALGKGGALETVVADQTGVFFDQTEESAVREAVERFEKRFWDRALIRHHADRFHRRRCEEAFRKLFIEYADQMS